MFTSANEPIRAKIPQPGGRVHFRIWALGVVLGLMTIWLYWPVTNHDFVNFDDDVYVTENIQVQAGLTPGNVKWAFSHPVCGNWHPLTMLTHMLDCQLYGLHPGGHHMTNVLLHALDSALLFWLLHRLTGTTWRSATVAALFACHPLHVESVAWVAERKDVLSAFFGFLSLYFYFQYTRDRQNKAPDATPKQEIKPPSVSVSMNYCLTWLSLALGLMSKPMLVTWPFVMLLLDYWPLNRFKPGSWRSLFIEKIPGLILIIAGSAMAFAVQKQTGATEAMGGLPFAMRCENAVLSYGRYVLKTFWPTDLAVFYPYSRYLFPIWVLLTLTVLCAVSAWASAGRQRYPFLFTGWFWFVGTLVPVIGIVQIGVQAMADRYIYIPSVGLFITVVWGLYELLRRWRHHRIALLVAGVSIIVLCAVLTRQQLTYWQNSETLFRHALNVTGDNLVARTDLAVALRNENRIDEAIEQFKVVARFQPDYAEARNDLGNLLFRQGHTNDAVAELQDVIRRKPEFAEAHFSLGRIFDTEGRPDDALVQYQEATRLKPDLADAHYNLGRLLTRQGQTDAAINQFQTTVRLYPNFPEARNDLGKLLAAKGRIDDAAIQFQEAARLKPDDFEAHNNLGNVLAIKNQNEAAAAQYEEAIRLKPDYAEAHFNLGNLFAGTGQPSNAFTQFQEAIRLNPNDAEAHYKLANLLVKQDQNDTAIRQFQEAVRLKPDYRDAHFNLGAMYLKTGQPAESVSQFQIVTRLDPNLAQGHCLLGMALAKNGLNADAIAAFQKAIQLKPDYAMARVKLGAVLENAGRLDEAIAQFQQAIRLRPDYAEAGANLAHALELKSAQPKP